MKISSVLSFGLCLTFAMGQDVVNEVGKKTIKTNTKAASTYQNCNCQCDSYTWSDGIYIRGNCRRYSRIKSIFLKKGAKKSHEISKIANVLYTT